MKKKNLHLIGAIAVGVVIIAATSYGVWKMNKDIDNVNIVELNIKASDWRTYKNEEFGFELQYPKKYENDDNYRTWDFEGRDQQEVYYGGGNSWGITKWLGGGSNGYEGYGEIISITVYSQEEMLKDFGYKLTGEKVLIGNNIIAEKIDYYGEVLLVERDKFFYFIESSFFSETEENKGATEFDEYQSILKTLKIN